jgi:putative hydrolase of the HAD superfamily
MGIRLGVVSNSEGHIEALLQHVGLGVHLELVVDSALEGVHKPDPEIFRRALTRLGVEPRQAIYVGDIPAVDVGGARAAGMEGVLIDAFGHHRDYADAPRVESVAELVGWWRE